MKRPINGVLLILAFLIFVTPLMAEEPDFSNLETVLDTFADSRKTRDLKVHGTAASQDAFTKTLEANVYQPVDRAVIQHLEQMPEFAGKRIVTHDFRTPGQDGVSVNTDRDVRVLVEVEMDRWIEVPVNKWEDVYYKEFAQKTGMKVDYNTPVNTLKKHAAKFRQLPTDRFHMEAGADFSDVGTIRVFEANGQTKVISTPNVVRAKKGFTRLKDPEGLARMYLEKADEQYRQAREIAREMKDGGLSNEEVRALRDRLDMHEIEGTVQLRKGVESLEALRTGYEKQGYDVGKLPDAFQKAIAEIKKVDGTSNTDIKKLKTQISALEPQFIKDLGDVNQKLRGQIEALKMAPKKPAKMKMPDISLAKAGKAAGIAGDILSIKDALTKAEQGNHLFINFDAKDSAGKKALKTMALAAIELSPIPVIDALERGWQVGEEEKEYLEIMKKHGESGEWETHPVTGLARMSTKVIYRTVSSMTLDPLIAGKTAAEEGMAAAKAISNNFIAEFSRQESEKIQRQKLDAFVKRSQAFQLDPLSIRANNGIYYGHVSPGDTLSLTTEKNDTWTSDYLLKWELIPPEGGRINLKEALASEEKAEVLEVTVPALPFGEYRVMLRSFERASGLQADFTELSFLMNAKTELGNIIATLNTVDGKPVQGEVSTGEVVAFRADKIGDWNSTYEVEWLVDGQSYRKKPADKEESNRLTLHTEDLKPGIHRVAARIFETTASHPVIVSHQAYDLKIKTERVELSPFQVAGFVERDTLIPLNSGAVQNSDILRFTVTLKPIKTLHPVVTTLFWQVYSHSGTPLEGLSKQVTLTEVDPEKEFTFRFRPDDLPDGKYVVALTHSLLSNPDNRVQAKASFEINDVIKIIKAVVTDNRETMEPKESFFPDQKPLFYVYYRMKPGIDRVSVQLSASKDGKLVDTASVERVLAEEKPPYRIGYTVSNGVFRGGDTGIFTAEISDSRNYRKKITREFKVVDYQASLSLPASLSWGKAGRFSITVPDVFTPPYRVELSPGSALSLGHKPGELTGTISGLHSGKDVAAAMRVQITDARGRVAKAENTVTVKKLQPVAVKPKDVYKPLKPELVSEVPVTPPAQNNHGAFQPKSQAQHSGSSGHARPTSAQRDLTTLGRARFGEIVEGIMRDVPSCMGSHRSTLRSSLEKDSHLFINELGGLSAAEFKIEKDKVIRGAAKNNLNILKKDGLDPCEKQWLSNYRSHGLLSAGEIEKVIQEEERYYVVFTLEGDKGKNWVVPTKWEVVDRKPQTGLFDRFPKKYATKGYAYKRWVVAVGPISRKKAEMYCDKARQGKVAITANYTPWLPTGSGTGYEMEQREYIAKSIGVEGGW